MNDRRMPRRNPWAVVLLVLIFCCAIAFVGAKIGIGMFQSDDFGSSRVMDIVNLQKVETVSDGLVYYDGSVVAAIDTDMDVKWSYMLGAGADIRASEYGVAAWLGNTLTLIEPEDGTMSYTGNMEKPILSARMDRRYTAVLTGEETNGKIILLDRDGRQVSQIVLEQVTAIDYGFFSDGSLLWIMVLDTNGTAPSCTIQTYRPGKEIVGSIHDSEQLTYAVLFQSSRVLVAGDSHLKTYDYTGMENKQQRRLIYGWKLADFDEMAMDPLMVFVNDAQSKNVDQIQDVRLIRSDLDRVMRLPFGCSEVRVVGDTLYGFASDGHVLIYPASAPTASSYQINARIDKVYGVTENGVAVLGNGNTLYLVTLTR